MERKGSSINIFRVAFVTMVLGNILAPIIYMIYQFIWDVYHQKLIDYHSERLLSWFDDILGVLFYYVLITSSISVISAILTFIVLLIVRLLLKFLGIQPIIQILILMFLQCFGSLYLFYLLDISTDYYPYSMICLIVYVFLGIALWTKQLKPFLRN